MTATIRRQAEQPSNISVRDMKVGDIGTIVTGPDDEHQPCKGQIVLKTYDEVVSLSRPINTWPSPSFQVRLLMPNEEVVLRP